VPISIYFSFLQFGQYFPRSIEQEMTNRDTSADISQYYNFAPLVVRSVLCEEKNFFAIAPGRDKEGAK